MNHELEVLKAQVAWLSERLNALEAQRQDDSIKDNWASPKSICERYDIGRTKFRDLLHQFEACGFTVQDDGGKGRGKRYHLGQFHTALRTLNTARNINPQTDNIINSIIKRHVPTH